MTEMVRGSKVDRPQIGRRWLYRVEFRHGRHRHDAAGVRIEHDRGARQAAQGGRPQAGEMRLLGGNGAQRVERERVELVGREDAGRQIERRRDERETTGK